MATYCFATESATYRAASDIENRINQLKNNGTSSQESELKGFEDFAVECSILKVAGSIMVRFVQTMVFKFLVGWVIPVIHQWKWLGEIRGLQEFMRVQTK